MSSDALDFTLFANINASEKESIPQTIIENLLSKWNEKCSELNHLEAERVKISVDNEQHKFTLEKEIVELKAKLEEAGDARSEAIAIKNVTEAKCKTLEGDLHASSERATRLLREFETVSKEKDDIAGQNVSLSALIESKTASNNQLETKLCCTDSDLKRILGEKMDAVLKSEEANVHKVQFDLREKGLRDEKALLERQIELLRRQLEEEFDEVRKMRFEHSSAITSLQGDLNHSAIQVIYLTEERDALLKSEEEKRLKIQSLQELLNSAKDAEVRLEESYAKELSSKERLANIYKASTEDKEKQVEELEKGIEELRQLLQEASEQFGALEKAKKRSEEEAQLQLDEKTLLLEDLKDELQKVNSILECRTAKDDLGGEMYPAAAAAKKLLGKGITLSQLYNEYMTVSEKYFRMEQEKIRLERYTDQILQEFEEKAPSLKRQKEDYQEALETNAFLRDEIHQMKDEMDKQREVTEESQRRANYIGRENDRLKQQIQDLSKQVTILLNQVESARAGLPPPPVEFLENHDVSSSANELISQRLVPFRNIKELQEQNQKLLVSIRDMAEKMDSAEKSAVEDKTKELTKKLEEKEKRLCDLANERSQMRVMLEEVKSSLDYYKVLAGHKAASETPQRASPMVNRNVEPLQKELAEAKKEIARLAKSHEEYCTEREKNVQLELGELKKMKSTFEKTKNDNIRLLSLAEYNEERLKVLQNNCDSYQRQLKALGERTSSSSEIIAKHETTIESLRNELKDAFRRLTREEIAATNLREEKILLKESQARLIAERDSMHNYQIGTQNISANLEFIKNNLERKDSEEKMKHQNQLADLMNQCSRLRAKIESNMDIKEAKLKVDALQKELDASRKDSEKTRNELLGTQVQMHSLKAQLHEAQEKTKATPISPLGARAGVRPTRSPTPGASPVRHGGLVNQSIRDLQVQLAEERSKLASLQTSLNQAQTNIANLTKFSSEQTKQLAEASEANKKMEAETIKFCKEVEERGKTIVILKESLQNAQQSEKAMKMSCDVQLMKFTEDLEERENELEEVQRRLNEAEQRKARAEEGEREATKLAAETQDKYEREVMLHGADLQALNALKEKLSSLSSEMDLHEKSKFKAEEEVADLKTKFEEKEAHLTKQSKDLTDRVKELETQNESLVNDFGILSDKMSNLETKLLSQSTEGGNTSFTEEDARSAEQLREVIKYLRREREIATTKLEVANNEAMRLAAQKKSLEGQVDLLNKYLSEEKQKNQHKNVNNAKQNELMRKIQTFDALTDSNRFLREEKETLTNNLEESTAKISSLNSQIEPLQEKIRDLTCKLDTLSAGKKALEDEKDLYRKRIDELVEKLNKARPEDLLNLQNELNNMKKRADEKNTECIRIKTVLIKTQKLLNEANQHRLKAEREIENSKAISEQNGALKMECERLKTQLSQSMVKQSQAQKEIQKLQEHNKQVLKEVIEFRQKDEELRLKIEALTSQLHERDSSVAKLNQTVAATLKQNGMLDKQVIQLRKIATKYKKIAESHPSNPEGDQTEEASNESREESLAVKKMEEGESSQDTNKRSELEKLKSEQKNEEISKLQEELQVLNSTHSQTTNKLEECQRKLSAYESQIILFKKEKEQHSQHIEGLQKKLQMQQRQIENLQKQSIASKGSNTGINIEKVTDTPPTANIKPMASPVAPVASRSQSAAQSGSSSSRSIPTASIRPMAPSQAGQSTSIVVVPPMEAHSGGDGAVSSTVTLPQATVTPTPAVPTSTSTQPFSFVLTATVSPTPLSTSIANSGEISQPQQSSTIGSVVQPSALSVHSSTSNVATIAPASVSQMVCMPPAPPLQGQQESNVISASSADSIISQAIALVAPHGDLLSDEPMVSSQPQSSGSAASAGPSRKRKLEEAQDEDESKRTCVESLDSSREALLEEDAGEPSSSSSQVGEKRVPVDDDEILVVNSDDDEEAAPSSHSRSSMPESEVRMDDDRDESSQKEMVIIDAQGGREAEVQQSSLQSEAEHRQEDHDTPESQVSMLSSFQQPSRPGRATITLTSQEQPTSSRQSVTPFQQFSQIEETDDRLVPSTPTLIVPRQGDFITGEGVSSPQVPSQDIVFGVSYEAIAQSNNSAQIIEGGTLDVTRMDLAQLDNGTPKPSITAPVPGSPSVKKVEVSSEGNISSSAGEGSSEVGSSPVKSFHETASFSQARAANQEEPDSGVEEVEAEDKEEEGEFMQVKEGQSGDESSPQASNPPQVGDEDSSGSMPEEGEEMPAAHGVEPQQHQNRTTRSSAAAAQSSSQRQASQAQQRRITPIIYEGERPQREATSQRGTRMMEGGQGRGAARGRPTARRSRPQRGPYGHM